MNPSFKIQHIRSLGKGFVDVTSTLIEKWTRLANEGQPIPIESWIQKASPIKISPNIEDHS